MLSGCLFGFLTKEPASFQNAGFMMAHFSVPETIFLASGKFIQPTVNFFIRFAKETYGLLTMIFKAGHDANLQNSDNPISTRKN
jgi:hypothetical protein